MKTIKIIDILCLYETGNYNELPKQIKIKDDIYMLSDTHFESNANFIYENAHCDYWLDNTMLDEEVEILGEDEFEDIESFGVNYSWDYIDYKNIEELKKYVNKDFQNIFDTLDKLIKNQKKILERLQNENSKDNF